MRGLHAAELLRRPVLLHGIRLGRIDDVIFDPEGSRVIGFDVLCGDGQHRFLPFLSVTLVRERLEVRSTLTLLDRAELDFYRLNGRSISEDGLRDAVVGADGLVASGDAVGHC